MITREEIKKLEKYLIDDFHGARVSQQREEQQFYDDKFPVPMIKPPQYLSRTGTSKWLIDGPAAHIITRNPQVFVDPKRETDKARESANKVNLLENHWVKRILMQSPQPFKEHVKDLLLRGEGWIHPVLNENWDKSPDILPVLFLIPDPLNIFASPEEEYGIPKQVIVRYERSPYLVEMMYPKWSNPKNAGSNKRKKTVEWLEYWDKDVRYFEADGVPVLKNEINPNIYGFVPFIHSYSGFGRRSPGGNPETLVVGRINKVKDLLIQECAINSDIDSTHHLFAHPHRTLIVPAGTEFNEEEFKGHADFGAGILSVVFLPAGATFDEGQRLEPSEKAFILMQSIRARIFTEAPPIMSGLPQGSSGRQEDIVGANFIRRFDSIVEETEKAFAKALDQGRNILKKVPTWLPITQWLEKPEGGSKEIIITEKDIDACAPSRIELKSADPIEDDRKLMAGRALYEGGIINWEEFLVEYAGYTPDKAKKIMQKTIAEKVVMTNPLILELIARKAMEQLGMTEEINILEQEVAQQTGGVGSQGGPPRTQNIRTPQGREMMDVALTQRGVRGPARQV